MVPFFGVPRECLLKSKVFITDRAEKQLKKIPLYLRIKFVAWINSVEEIGIDETRKIPGFHDEPLKGRRLGQRSIRLNRAYRAFYIEEGSLVTLIKVIEVNKHDY